MLLLWFLALLHPSLPYYSFLVVYLVRLRRKSAQIGMGQAGVGVRRLVSAGGGNLQGKKQSSRGQRTVHHDKSAVMITFQVHSAPGGWPAECVRYDWGSQSVCTVKVYF